VAAVALIGPDGAGKTTIARMLQQSAALRVRYLYMGVDIPASNVALPTSRVMAWLKARRGVADRPGAPPLHAVRRRRGRPRDLLRLVNTLAEEWFRQAVSWVHEARGFVVLYDRHFVYDFAPEITGRDQPLDRRIHRWCLQHLSRRPDLVIFLDAPGELLFARKGESTVEELERRRQAFRQLGARVPGFVRVDAARPLAEVHAEVVAHVTALAARRRTAVEESRQ
jgi:thymidylate kinase